jgi:hypothetical protein
VSLVNTICTLNTRKLFLTTVNTNKTTPSNSFISDTYPINGLRRRPYFFIFGFCGFLCYLLLAVVASRHELSAVPTLTFASLSIGMLCFCLFCLLSWFCCFVNALMIARIYIAPVVSFCCCCWYVHLLAH